MPRGHSGLAAPALVVFASLAGTAGAREVADSAAAADVAATLSYRLAARAGRGASAGDVLDLRLRVENRGRRALAGLRFVQPPIPNARLLPGTVLAKSGRVLQGNASDETIVTWALPTLAPGAATTLRYQAAVDDPLPAGLTRLAVQGVVFGPGIGGVPTADPERPRPGGATLVPIDGHPWLERDAASPPAREPSLRARKTVFQLSDEDHDGRLGPGDRLGYLILITSRGGSAHSAVLRDTPDANAPLVAGTVVAPFGATIIKGNQSGDTNVEVDWASISFFPKGVFFQARIDNPLAPGIQSVANQGFVEAANAPATPTDDPHTEAANDATVTNVVGSETPIAFTPPPPANVTSTRHYTAAVAARDGFTYLWAVTNGSIPAGGETGVTANGLNTVTFTAGEPGPDGTTAPLGLTVTETRTGSGSSSSATASSTVFPNPEAAAIVVTDAAGRTLGDDAAVTAGEPLHASVAHQAGITVAWTAVHTSPAGQSGEAFDFEGTSADPAGNAVEASLTATFANAIGDTASRSATLHVFPRPVAPVVVVKNAAGVPLADGTTVAAGTALHAEVGAQPGITFRWTGTNTSPATQNGGVSFDFTATNPSFQPVVATLSAAAVNPLGFTATSAVRTLGVAPAPPPCGKCPSVNLASVSLDPSTLSASVAIDDDVDLPQSGTPYYEASTTASPLLVSHLRRRRRLDLSVVCDAPIVGERIVGAPVDVALSGASPEVSPHVVLVSTDAGKVYRFDTQGCGLPWLPTWARSLRRSPASHFGECPLPDSIAAAPAVVRADRYTGPGAPPAADLVVVPTRYGCTTTDNRVFALNAATGAVVWESNMYAAPADSFVSSCTVDNAAGQVYCGAVDPGGAFQGTLFAYASNATGVVAPVWQANPGSIVNRVVRRADRLIVATQQGTVVAYDLSTAAATPPVAWSLGIPGAAFDRSPSPVNRPGFDNAIHLVDRAGFLRRIDEVRSSDPALDRRAAYVVGAAASPGPGVAITTEIASCNDIRSCDNVGFCDARLCDDNGKLYVGTSDGRVWQVDTSNAGFLPSSFEASIGVGLGAVQGTAIEIDPTTHKVAAMLAVSSDKLQKLAIPFVPGCDEHTTCQAPLLQCRTVADCPGAPTPQCQTVQCLNLQQNPCAPGDPTCSCAYPPANEGFACAAEACAGPGQCSNGACVASDYSSCTCESDGGPACAPGLTCCGGGICSSLEDSSNCGACGQACSPGEVCSNRHCVRANACVTPSLSLLLSAAPKGVDAVAFDGPVPASPAPECRAYATSTATVSGLFPYYRADRSGVQTFLLPPATAQAPLNGIAVAADGAIAGLSQTHGTISPQGQDGFLFHDPRTNQVVPPTIPVGGDVLAPPGPYLDTRFDTAGVGPALAARPDGTRRFFMANVQANGALWAVDARFTGSKWVLGNPSELAAFGSRITAIAFARRQPGNEGWLYLGIGGTIVPFCQAQVTNDGRPCLLAGRTLDLTLSGLDYADFADPAGTQAKSPITGILSISADPLYGGAFVSARDETGRIQVLYVDSAGLSVRNFASWPFRLSGAGTPPSLGTVDLRVSASPVDLWAVFLGSFAGGSYSISTFGLPR